VPTAARIIPAEPSAIRRKPSNSFGDLLIVRHGADTDVVRRPSLHARETHTRPRMRRARASVIAVAIAAVTLAAAIASAPAATSSTVVTMEVPSAITITNGCRGDAATAFGVVQPGSPALTATGAGRCSVAWTSSNDSSMLRIAQRDGTGTAMSRPASFAGPSDWARFKSVSSLDGANLVAGGDGGTFSRSADSGATWTHTGGFGGSTNEIYAVEQVPGDATVTWVVGDGQRLQRVTNSLVAPVATSRFAALQASGWPAGVSPNAVAVIDANVTIVGGDAAGWMARTTDAGVSWTSYQLPSAGAVRDLSIAPTGHVWAATSSAAAGNLWRVPVGSGSAPGDWTQYPAGPTTMFSAVRVTGAANGYAVGTAGAMYSWNGATWTWRGNYDLEDDSYSDVSSPPGSPATANAYGNDGSILRTTNGGTSWSRVESPVGTDMSTSASGAGWLIVVGLSRSVISSADGGATFTFTSDRATARARRGIALDPTNGRIVLAVGTRGSIWRSTDGGATWASPASGTTQALYDVDFATSSIVWAVGSAGTILRSTDAGITWSTMTSGTTQRLLSVDAPSATRVVSAGDAGVVVRSSNGGASFTSNIVAGAPKLSGVSMGSDTVGVAVGGDTLVRTSDGGATWSPAASTPGTPLLRSVSMVDGLVGFIAPTYGTLWRTADGGATWTSTPLASGTALAIEAVTDKVMYVAGTMFSSTIDGGATWTIQAIPGSKMVSLEAGDANHVVAGATAGAVHRREASMAAGVQIPDYGIAPNSWAPSAQAMFGVCVQAVGAQTSIALPWIDDADTCSGSDADPWRGVPVAATTVATVPIAGNSGSVDLVFGVRFPADQAPGTYTAGVVFEALAPAA
jgi:photosystem II stability/assembly factor-like uncharacterized protein